MKGPTSQSARTDSLVSNSNVNSRRAIGYIRVSTDMQASEGLSLDAQQSAIEQYCSLQGLRLVKVCKDVISGGKDQRPGLHDALASLERGADVLVVLKFDRLSRSIRHFCELYERYFKNSSKELVAIRESIRLDSALGRALISILLVFAQMEREATGERTRESIRHIRESGYHFGRIPYGKKAIPAPDNPRMRILVDDESEQAVLAQLKAWAAEDVGISEMARRLNAAGTAPPQGDRWNKNTIYNLKLRLSWITKRPHNERPHSDEELKQRLLDLRGRGHTHQQIASILNEQGWVPLKGRRFTEITVRKLLSRCQETKLLSPRRFLENMLERLQQEHERAHPEKPFRRPGYPRLAKALIEAGYPTPKGRAHWWPAQVQQLLEGKFERYYSRHASAAL
ncbi:MAG: recombinase family protein [Polyangia bacterium]